MPAVKIRIRETDDYGNVVCEQANSDHGPNFASDLQANVAHVRHLGDDRTPQPGGRARGLHNPAETYFAMDVVSFNGSEWRAIRDDPGELPGSGWHLGAKGARGKPGPPGVHVTAIETVGYCVVVSLSNGQTLRANLLPMLERFKKESKP